MKELFYTLENIQVDCRDLTDQQIKEMADIFEKNGFNLSLNGITDKSFYLRLAKCKESVNLFRLDDTKTTITYDKFMELFNVKEHKSGWYKSTEKGKEKFLAYHDFEKGVKYGIDILGDWFFYDDSMDRWYTDNLIKASDKEAELRLIKEAVSRGFKKGAKFNYDGLNIYCVDDNIYLKNNVLYYGGFPIMKNGVWADIITPELEAESKKVQDEIKVIFECKDSFTKVFNESVGYLKWDEENTFKTISESIASLLEHKGKMYGNSVLEPLNIFANKTKAGQRIDDKLSRVKNSTELRKNDVCDLIGYLYLVCKENNWTNFDEFKD